MLMHTIYDLPAYQAVLPAVEESGQDDSGRRRHRRFSVRCPAKFVIASAEGVASKISLEIIQLSRYGFLAYALVGVPIGVWGEITIQLGPAETSNQGRGLAGVGGRGLRLRLGEPDLIWRKFVNALYSGSTHADLENATRFMTDR
jgi:hypothetical protein